MTRPKINFLAVVIASVAMWILGAIWYTALSGLWMEYTGITEEMAKSMSASSMVLDFVGSFVAYLVMFYVMAHFIHYAGATDIKGALQTGFWLWLGFDATAMFVGSLYTDKPIGLFLIDSIYWLLGILIGGIILVKMKKKETAAG